MDPQTQPEAISQNTVQTNQAIDDVENQNQGAIHYEDGKIQKKQYGAEEGGPTANIYVHLIEKTKSQVQTVIVNAELSLNLGQFVVLLQEKNKIALNSAETKLHLEGEKVKEQALLSQLFKEAQGQSSELYIFYDQTKAIIKQKQPEVKYEPIHKYSFLEDGDKVKVYLELPGIGKIPNENITSRFLEWSIEVKILGYNGKNWLFAVPKTQCLLRPKESKVIQKQNKLIISIQKNVKNDNWFSLYKVKCIGEKDD